MQRNLLSACLIVLSVACLLFSLSPGTASGAGYALIEQSVTGLGNAYAGGSAVAEDASTIFYNPAGMIRLKGQQSIAGGHVIIPSMQFTNQGSTHVLQGVTKVPLLGSNGPDGGVTKVIPNIYYSAKVNDRFAVGIGINTPFGLATDYDYTWVGRYHAIGSDVLTVNFNPSFAYKVTDQFSFGGGVNIQYYKAKLSNAIDFGTLDALGRLGLPPGALKLVPQMADGYAFMKGDSWGAGFNLGLLYEFTPNTRAGIAYRSKIKQTLTGDVSFTNVPTGLAPVPVFKNGGIHADVTLPDSLSVSFVHAFNPQWTVMADFSWTNWSVFKELRIRFDNPAQPDSVTTENWQDTYRGSLGVTYRPEQKWTFRGGVAYDTSAVASDQYRTPRIPDNDRFWLACGVGYKLADWLNLDIGYAHLFISDSRINKTPTGEDAARGGLVGTYTGNINIVSAQLSISF